MSGRGGQFSESTGRSARRGFSRPASFVLVSILALGIAGCQVAPNRASQVTNSSSAQSTAAQAPAIAVQPAKQTPLATTPAAAQDVTPVAPLHLTGDPKELVGLDRATVRRALGDPMWVRNDAPAQVWQYATGECIVDLYLYNRDGALTVTYVEARSHTAQIEPTARCLRSLLERPTASAS